MPKNSQTPAFDVLAGFGSGFSPYFSSFSVHMVWKMVSFINL